MKGVTFFVLVITQVFHICFCSIPKCESESALSNAEVEENCILASKASDVKTWLEAITYCKEKGGQLVEMYRRQKNVEVSKTVLQEADAAKLYWTGLSDIGHIDLYVWNATDYGLKLGLYYPWEEQDLEKRRLTEDEDIGNCVALQPNLKKPRWILKECTEKLPFLCEKTVAQKVLDEISPEEENRFNDLFAPLINDMVMKEFQKSFQQGLQEGASSYDPSLSIAAEGSEENFGNPENSEENIGGATSAEIGDDSNYGGEAEESGQDSTIVSAGSSFRHGTSKIADIPDAERGQQPKTEIQGSFGTGGKIIDVSQDERTQEPNKGAFPKAGKIIDVAPVDRIDKVIKIDDNNQSDATNKGAFPKGGKIIDVAPVDRIDKVIKTDDKNDSDATNKGAFPKGGKIVDVAASDRVDKVKTDLEADSTNKGAFPKGGKIIDVAAADRTDKQTTSESGSSISNATITDNADKSNSSVTATVKK